jgi:long-chain acyl-CoA synthetase
MSSLVTLHDLVDGLAAFETRPALIAFTDEGRREWSYGQLARTVRELAQGLAATGLGPGHAVALFAPDRPEWIAAALAALRTGAMAIPLDAQFADESLSHVLTDSGPRLIFTVSDRIDRLARLRPEARLVSLDTPASDPTSWRHGLRGELRDLPRGRTEDVAMLFYTSGTTGPPKGVPLTHSNLVFQVNTLLAVELLGPSDRVCLPLPLHHVYPFVLGVLTPLALGLPLVLPQALTGPHILRALRDGEATVLVGVPRLYSALLSAIEGQAAGRGRARAAFLRLGLALSVWARRRLGLYWGKRLLWALHAQLAPTLRLVASGGAALDPAVAWKLEGLGWQLASGYGLTETSPLLTLNLPGSPHPDTAGKPVPGVVLRIMPARGGPSGEGEIQARGPGVFGGYLNLPEKTREAFTPDGWFRTGDLGYLDADDLVHVTGRIDEMLVTAGGENVYPENVEAVFLRHPFIREFALLQKDSRLVGLVLPDPGKIREAGHHDVARAIREAVAEINPQLPSYQRVADLAITRDPLPRTRLGKFRRPSLPVAYDHAKVLAEGGALPRGPIAVADMAEADRPLLEHGGARAVWQLLCQRYPDRRLTMDVSPALDLGVDSLEWLAITLEIERRAAIELDEAAITRVGTVRDLLREVTAAPRRQEGAPGVPWDEPERLLTPAQARWLTPLGPGLTLVSRGLFALSGWLMRAVFRLRVVGLGNLPEEPYLLAPNHVSLLDPLAVSAALSWRRLARTYWGGWTGIAFGNPLMRVVSRLGRVLPIEPERGVGSSLALAAAVLKRGDCLVWFPEGERSVGGELLPFRPGIGLLLYRFPRPVVPVYVHGTFEALPRGRRWPRPRPVTVVFGAPLEPWPWRSAAPETSPEAAARRIAQTLQAAVAGLGPRSRRSAPTDPPDDSPPGRPLARGRIRARRRCSMPNANPSTRPLPASWSSAARWQLSCASGGRPACPTGRGSGRWSPPS